MPSSYVLGLDLAYHAGSSLIKLERYGDKLRLLSWEIPIAYPRAGLTNLSGVKELHHQGDILRDKLLFISAPIYIDYDLSSVGWSNKRYAARITYLMGYLRGLLAHKEVHFVTPKELRSSLSLSGKATKQDIWSASFSLYTKASLVRKLTYIRLIADSKNVTSEDCLDAFALATYGYRKREGII